MTCIPDGSGRICRTNLKLHYLKNKRIFLDFLLHFLNVHEIYNFLEKNMSILAYLFQKLLAQKEVFT